MHTYAGEWHIVSPSPPTLTLHCRITQNARPGGTRCNNDDMNIQLNGTPRALPDNVLLSALLELEGLSQRRVAVEVNGEIVSRGLHATHALREGDVVEIVHALGGG